MEEDNNIKKQQIEDNQNNESKKLHHIDFQGPYRKGGIKDFMWDKRIVERNIRAGRMKLADYENYLKSLPDVTEKMEEVNYLLQEDEKEITHGT